MSQNSGVAESKDDEKKSGNNDVQFKTGQKYPTPSPGSGDRVFYETLLQQRPDSEMAQDWCLSYGVLSTEKAAQLQRQINNRKNNPKGSRPNHASPVKKSVTNAVIAKNNNQGIKRKQIIDGDEIIGDTGEFIMISFLLGLLIHAFLFFISIISY